MATNEFTAKKLVEIAVSQLGYHEKNTNANLDSNTASNDGSGNYTKYARDLRNAGYYNGNKNGYAWCDVFVDWCFYQLANQDAKKAQEIECQTGDCGAGCIYSAQYYRAQNRFFSTPEVGDQIFFGVRGNEEHTGIVETVSASSITTIEGNSGDQVQRNSYSRSNSRIVGYGRPKFSTVISSITPTTSNNDSQLSKGSEGAEVKELQTNLIKLGYSCGSAGADGDFGNDTLAAVKKFQTVNGLEADGIVGPLTWAAIEAALKKPNSALTPTVSTSVTLTGNSNEEKIWNYLYAKLGNAYGVAGIMGNMYAESSLNPQNLQNTYEKKLGMTDAQYTAAVDNKSYTNFVHDSAGYGLVQWTYWSLKEELLKYVQSKGASIGDLEIQLEFLCKQLSESYASSVWNVCKNAKSILEASNAMLLKFERPADQGEATQAKRAGYGQTYYDKYAKSSNSTREATPVALTTEGIATASVKIGHASINEKGKTTGGAAGDQNGKEVCTVDWYNNPWLKVFRPNDSAVAEKIAKAMEQACANDKIGYDQKQRTTLFKRAKANNFDLSKIKIACETDCSALVAVCVNAAGISVPNDLCTNNEEQVLTETGKFITYTNSQYVNSSDYLKRGDILLGSEHTAVVLSNGPKASAFAYAAQPVQSSVGPVIGTAVAKTSMYIRSGDSTSYASLGIISANTTVEVLEVLSSGWYKIVWPKASCGYAYTSNNNNQYYTYTAKSAETTANYLVKINADALNIRQGPDTSYAIVGCIKDRGTYTIVKQNGNWGYLKSGAGWICLDYTIRR